MIFKYLQLIAVLIYVGVLSIAPQSIGKEKAAYVLACKFITPIEQSYLSRHINYSKESRNLETRTIDQFLRKMDPAKIYLLESDVRTMKSSMKGIFKTTQQQDCSVLTKSRKILVKRVEERVKFIRSYLGSKFKFNKATELTLDPDERKRPKSVKEANEFHKKYVQFQVSNYLATDMPLKEAKEYVIRSYERILRRTKKYRKTDLWSSYLDAFARSLDPHSSYLSSESLEEFQIQMGLSLEGIGATLSSKDGFTVIEQLIPGGAAARSGLLKPKDKILAVAGGKTAKPVNVVEKELRDVVRKIRGKKGTLVRLTILRGKGKDSRRFEVPLVRDKIKLEDEAASITYHEKKVNNKKFKIGLVNLPSFYADNRKNGRSAAKDLKKLLTKARKAKVDGVVLDLSTNPGGSLDDAVKIAGLFIRKGNVVKQSNRDPKMPEIVLADEDPAVDFPGPLVILTSRISASASEIVSGTLKDYRRAVVVGADHSFGKGSVQSVEPLPPGLGAIKTTVGMFFTPGGNSTQHRGVSADIVLPTRYATDEMGEKTLDYSLPPKKIKPFLSAEAHVPSGPSAWKLVDKKLIKHLEKNSKIRVAKSEKFKKLRKQVAKAKKRGKLIKVSSVFESDEDKEKEESEKEGEKAKDKKTKDGKLAKADKDKAKKEKDKAKEEKSTYLTKEEKVKKYLERADIQEAINVAADMVTYYKKGKGSFKVGKKQDP